MIDLDDTLRAWVTSPPEWSSAAAVRLAKRVAAGDDLLAVSWEPGDDEWVRLAGDDDVRATVHVRYPLAFADHELAARLRAADPAVTVIAIPDYDADDLRGSPDLLRATILPHLPWSDDFDPAHFSAADLFFESV
ncbi:hypothetical protein AB0J74_05245 [Asanoa sp. NPDC049573]|uniref:hypothetical protein n=1 Tax=Asanoa sp. NPDC049573 TaxID=3155396 RepID=UPI0034413147